MVEVAWDGRLFAETRRWIEASCTSEERLAEAVGIAQGLLDRLRSDRLVPHATYEVGSLGVRSPVARMGGDASGGTSFYGPAVVAWLRRCAAHADGPDGRAPRDHLRAWLAADFAAALRAEAGLGRRYGWTHLFDRDGRLDEGLAARASDALWGEWLRGGWAVCLNRFDGHHVVVKDIEVARVAALADRVGDPTATVELVDAMLRYDAVARPFAPFERGMSSRRRTIDDVAATGRLPWPSTVAGRRAEPARRAERATSEPVVA